MNEEEELVSEELSGNRLNITQVPKVYGGLESLVARKGYTFVTLDFDALEDKVLAGLSKDPAKLALVGPNAKHPPLNEVVEKLQQKGLKYEIVEGVLIIYDEF